MRGEVGRIIAKGKGAKLIELIKNIRLREWKGPKYRFLKAIADFANIEK